MLKRSESSLPRRPGRGRCNFQIRAGDQRLQVGRAHDAQLRPHHPELATRTGDPFGASGDLRLYHHPGQIVGKGYRSHRTHLQALVTNRCPGSQPIGTTKQHLDGLALGQSGLAVGMQHEPRDTLRQRCLGIGRIECDTACEQALQRLTAHLNAGQPPIHRDPTGVPEPGRSVDQLSVGRLDVHPDDHAPLVARELVTLYRPYLDLAVKHRAADIQRAELVSSEHQMQPRGTHIQRRCLGSRLEAALHRTALFAGAHGDVVALDQRFQASDTAERNGWLDHPELGVLHEIVFEQRVNGKRGLGTRKIRLDSKCLQRAHLHALVDQGRPPGLEPLEIGEGQGGLYPGLGRVEVFIQTEGQAGVGRRAILPMLRRRKSNAPGDDTGERLGTKLDPSQPRINGDSAGVPETGVFTHQVSKFRLDEQLYLNGRVVLGQYIVLDLPNLDLAIKDRAAAVQRAEPFGL